MRWAAALLGVAALLGCASPVVEGNQHASSGGHFRYATIFWRKTDDATSNTIEVTVESAWRRSYSSSYFTSALGAGGEEMMKINGKETPELDFGDGTSQFLESVKITAYSETEDWFMGQQVFTKTYNTPNNNGQPWELHFKGCCRMSGLVNNPDASWDMVAHVDLIEFDMSARVVSLPVVSVMRVGSSMPDPNQSFKLNTAQLIEGTTWTLAMPNPHQQISNEGVVHVNTHAVPEEGGTMHLLAYFSIEKNGHSHKVPVDILIMITPLSTPQPQFIDFPGAALTARPGFPVDIDIKGYQPQAGAEQYVGFTVGALPDGAHLSTVRGKGASVADPATMTFHWTPCVHQIGTNVICFDVVNSDSVAATQRCLMLNVVHDEPPQLSFVLDGAEQLGRDPSDPSQHHAMTPLLSIGLEHKLKIIAFDPNPQDKLTIRAVPAPGAVGGPLEPPGSTIGMEESSQVNGGTQHSVVLSFAPKHDHGGYKAEHCWEVSDDCGSGCETDCPGGKHVTVACVVVVVRRCEFVVREGQQLQQVAAIYGSDWLQLWSHNQRIMHPDMQLSPADTLNIGHLYDVQPYDKPAEVAERFGMSAEGFARLNADVAVDKMGSEVCTTVTNCQGVQWCVLPNSCTGKSGSIYQKGFEDQGWYASATDGSAPSAMPPANPPAK